MSDNETPPKRYNLRVSPSSSEKKVIKRTRETDDDMRATKVSKMLTNKEEIHDHKNIQSNIGTDQIEIEARILNTREIFQDKQDLSIDILSNFNSINGVERDSSSNFWEVSGEFHRVLKTSFHKNSQTITLIIFYLRWIKHQIYQINLYLLHKIALRQNFAPFNLTQMLKQVHY